MVAWFAATVEIMNAGMSSEHGPRLRSELGCRLGAPQPLGFCDGLEDPGLFGEIFGRP